MSPKKIPVRIGLKKKEASASTASAPAPVTGSDSDLQILSESTMKVLEALENADDDEDVDGNLYELPDLEDEMERDLDPDYVPEAVPSTSSAVVKGKHLLNRPNMPPKRSLNLVKENVADSDTPTKATGKGRSNAPIWIYFIVSDRKVGGHMQKGAECIVEVGKAPCGKRIMQNGSSTTGLNQHLERRHPKEYALYKKAQATLQAERMTTKRTLVEHFEDLEGEKYDLFR